MHKLILDICKGVAIIYPNGSPIHNSQADNKYKF
jgi:hypothetical protein